MPSQPVDPAQASQTAHARPLMAGWPVGDPSIPAPVVTLFGEANPRLGALPDDAWGAMTDVEVMVAAFPDWTVVATVETRPRGGGVPPCILLQHEPASGPVDGWLLVTGAGDRLCATRAEQPERPYRLVVHPRYHRAWTGTLNEVMTTLCAETPPVGWHRLPSWVAGAVAAHAARPGASEAEVAVAAEAGEWSDAVWTMHRLTART